MKLYDGGRAPNPRRVRIFLAEKDRLNDLKALCPGFGAVTPVLF